MTIPARKTPQYFKQPDKGSNSLARSCTPMEATCTNQGCILEVNPVSLKYWDPKEENGGPKREEKEELFNVSNSVANR